MALRWRNYGKGKLYCAAQTQPQPRDTYIDDALHYQLAVEMRVLRSIGGKPEQWEWVFERKEE